MFTRADKPELMRNCDPDVLIRVASRIMETSDMELAEKKLLSQSELISMFALAEHLGKTVAEIENLTIDEWHHWLAYFKLKKQYYKTQ